MANIDSTILERVNKWLNGDIDDATKSEISNLLINDSNALIDAFYRDLEFGTGGLRGIMGAGTNRMNKYTVAMATQGLANYIKLSFPSEKELKAAIAYDSRTNSALFAKITADVLAANGFKVFLFDELRPTPELSFAIRHLNCQTGVVITASHNPKEYNGYKVYWNDGGQLVNPHDKNVIEEVLKIKDISEVKMTGNPENIVAIGEDVDKVYLEHVKNLALLPLESEQKKKIKIVYTPIHGTGITLVPKALKDFGFSDIFIVGQQAIPDGNFPTVNSPNPEEPAALQLGLNMAKDLNADVLLGTDPDADRVGVAVKNNNGDYVLLNGNQTASILVYYILSVWNERKLFKGNEFIVKTIVTSELLKNIADSFKVECFDVLTGFKFIAEIIKSFEGEKQFICGGEESYGYLVGDFVREKDAVISCCMIAEAVAWAAQQGKTPYQLLAEIYTKFGFYKETLLSITKKGKEGAEAIKQMMVDYRNKPLPEINGQKIVLVKDYLLSLEKNIATGENKAIALPKSDVLQFFLQNGSKITVRPSGTEPKIKFYFGIKGELKSPEYFEQQNALLDVEIKKIIDSMKLMN